MSKLRPDPSVTLEDVPKEHTPTSHWNDLGKLQSVVRALLLFHSSGPWTIARHAEWERLLVPILGDEPFDVTTKTLCDAARAVLENQ